MHKLEYKDFLNVVKLLSLQYKKVDPYFFADLSLLEIFMKCTKNPDLILNLKSLVLSEKKLSIKISNLYLCNKNLYYQQEGISIYRQIVSFYESNVRLVDLVYILSFLYSDFYLDLYQRLDLVTKRNHRSLLEVEKIFETAFLTENILTITNTYDLLQILDNTDIYNNYIHEHILLTLENSVCDNESLLWCKKLISIIKKQNFLYATDKARLNRIYEKIYTVELALQINKIINKYLLPMEMSSIENIENNIKQFAEEFKSRFTSAKGIQSQIDVMKDFSVLLPFKEFQEISRLERYKMFEYLHKIVKLEYLTICQLNEIVNHSCYLISLFFYNEKNVFISFLNTILDKHKHTLLNEKQRNRKLFSSLLNSKLLVVAESRLKFALDSEILYLFTINRKDLEKEHYDTIIKAKKMQKSLKTFILLTNEMEDDIYEIFENELEQIFILLVKILNVKIKYFINQDFESKLEKQVNELQYKYITLLLLIYNFEQNNVSDIKPILQKSLYLCLSTKLATAYTKHTYSSNTYIVKIYQESDLLKIFDIIEHICFDKLLFNDLLCKIIDELVVYYEKIKTFCKMTRMICDTRQDNLDINHCIHKYNNYLRSKKKLKKEIPRFIKLKLDSMVRDIKQPMIYFYKKNKSLLTNYCNKEIEALVLVIKIQKCLWNRKYNLELPNFESYDNVIGKFEKWKCQFYDFLSNSSLDFCKKECKTFFLHIVCEIKKNLNIYKMHKTLQTKNYEQNKGLRKLYFAILKESKIILLYFAKLKGKTINIVINHAKDSCKPRLLLINKLCTHETFVNKHRNVLDILTNYSEQDLRDLYNNLELSREIVEKLDNLQLDVSRVTIKINDNIFIDCKSNITKALDAVDTQVYNLLADIDAVDRLPEFNERCVKLREKIRYIIDTCNLVNHLISDIYRYNNNSVFNMLVLCLQKPILEVNLDEVIKKNNNYKEKIRRDICVLRENINELYFVSDEDIIKFMSDNLSICELLKNIYDIDAVIIKNDRCLGLQSKNEKLIFLSDFSIVDSYKSTDDTKLFFLTFKEKLHEVLFQYLKLSFYDKTFEPFHKIAFLDEFLNEYRYFNNLEYVDNTKIRFLKQHESKFGNDFRILYPKPKILCEKSTIKVFVEDIEAKTYDVIYNTPSFILYTRLINTVFNKISLGLNHYVGLILYGPSSTGKTETVKYYCRSIGKQIFMFCCNETLDFETINNIYNGCVKNAWWLCLDECNRLRTDVMIELCNLLNENRIKVFLTLNIGYIGRNEFPTALKSLFLEIRMEHCDADDVLSVFFTEKDKHIYNRIKEQSSSLPHYNFSLRAIKSIASDSARENITQSMLTYFYAMLNKKDKKLLKNYVSGFTKEYLFEYGISKNSGILLYGASLSGKSELLRKIIKSKNVNYAIFHTYDEEILCDYIKKNTDREFWIIYDLILDSSWIENLNSVLDDNKVLCMKSGEIVKINKNIKFIFETNNIEKVSYATLTRVYTIYFDMPEEISYHHNANDKIKTFYIDILGCRNYQSLVNLVKSASYDRVTFLEGQFGIGKKTRITNILSSNEIMYLNCKEIKTLVPYVCKFIYLEEYKHASEEIRMEIKEFYEFGTIKDKVKNCCLFVSYDGTECLQKFNFNNRINANIIKFALADDNNEYFDDINSETEFKNSNNLKTQKEENINVTNHKTCDNFSNNEDIWNLFKTKKIKYYECFKILKSHLVDRNYLKEILQNKNDVCIKEMIEFFISNSLNFIIVGERLAGKNWIIKNYKLNVIQIFTKNSQITYSKDLLNVILTTNLDLLSSKIIKENYVVKLYCPTKIVIDCQEFFQEVALGLVSNQENVFKYKFVKNLKFKKCNCCLNGETEIQNATKFEDIIAVHKFDYAQTHSKLNKLYDQAHKQSTYNAITNLSFSNVFKLRDFVNTTLKIYQNFKSINEFTADGLTSIQTFYKMSQNKKKDLDENNRLLCEIDVNLNDQILNVKKLEQEVVIEKNKIEQRKNEHRNLYDKINEKKKYIESKLNNVRQKLEKSKSKLNKITKKNIAEIRSMNNPPQAVHYVINRIYNMFYKEHKSENKLNQKPWKELLVFLKSFTIENIINATDIQILDIEELKARKNEIMKSSYVCFLFYEWIVDIYEYNCIKQELQPFQKEIDSFYEIEKDVLNSIKNEEQNFLLMEKKIEKHRSDCKKHNDSLHCIREKTKILKDEIEVYDTLIAKIEEEKANWKILVFNLAFIIERFFENKILLSDNTNINNYSFTNTKDKNFYRVIYNLFKYKKDIVVYNATIDCELYKLCKFQIEQQDFNIILSSSDLDFYDCIGYRIEIVDHYKYPRDVNVMEKEKAFLQSIVRGNINAILNAKNELDNVRIEYKKLQAVRKYYDDLNYVYKVLYKQYNLEFRVYNDFIVKNNINISSFLSKEALLDNAKIYCTFFHFEDIHKYDCDVLIITDTEDYVYYLKKCITFAKNINIGDKQQCELFKTLLENTCLASTAKSNVNDHIIDQYKQCDDPTSSFMCSVDIVDSGTKPTGDIFLVSNIDLYPETIINKSSNKFIYISEYVHSRKCVKNCRVLDIRYNFDYKRSIEFYTHLFGTKNLDLITYHCKRIRNLYKNNLEKKYKFTINDLNCIIKNRNIVSFEYLKELFYINKLDDSDIDKVMQD